MPIRVPIFKPSFSLHVLFEKKSLKCRHVQMSKPYTSYTNFLKQGQSDNLHFHHFRIISSSLAPRVSRILSFPSSCKAPWDTSCALWRCPERSSAWATGRGCEKKKQDNLDNMMQRHRYSCRMPGFRTHAKLTLCSICRESIPGSNSLQNAGLRELQHGNQHDKTTSYI